MANNGVPLTERKYYQQPLKNEWMSRNNEPEGFYAPELTISHAPNGFLDDEGMTDISQSFSRKPTLNYVPQHQVLNSSMNFNSSHRPIIDSRNRGRTGSRKGKAKRTLRQSLVKAYNNQPFQGMGNTTMKFGNFTIKKRKQGNIFSGEKAINIDTDVRVNRNIIPAGNFTALNSPNGSFVGSTPRIPSSSRNNGDNIFKLKRQIGDLRELLKERDQELLEHKMTYNMGTIQNTIDNREELAHENKQLRRKITSMEKTNNGKEVTREAFMKLQQECRELKEKLRRMSEVNSSDQRYGNLSQILQEKDQQIQKKDELLRQKDEVIKYLEAQLKRYQDEKSAEQDKVMEKQNQLKNKEFYKEEITNEQQLAQEFFIRLANFLFKKKLTLYQVIHHKIFDKMINGVEVELIHVEHFWRMLHKQGFKTITSERTAVNNLVKNKVLHEIFEVKTLRNVLEKLGIVEDVPLNTKEHNYEDLSGYGIRVINKIIREMQENKIFDLEHILGKENIETKRLTIHGKSMPVDIVKADNFLKALREREIIKRWEDLDENLQLFLRAQSSNGEDTDELLMVSKLKKCIQDFKGCEFFEYYGFEPRNEGDIDSDHEEDEFQDMTTIKNRLNTLK